MNRRSTPNQASPSGPVFPRPGKALTAAIVGLLAVWITFAVGINWGGGGANLFELGVGDTHKILRGEVWRLFTAPLLHLPTGPGSVGHIVSTLLGLYFLAPALEKKWGGRWMLAFLYGSALVGYLLHMLLQIAVPSPHDAALQQPWFGSLSAVHAVAVAWALSFRGQRVMLFLVLPVTSTVLIVFVVGVAVLRLLAADNVPEGVVSAFGAMGFAWLVAGSEPSPLRRLWLRWRLRKLARTRTDAKIGAALPQPDDPDDEEDTSDDEGVDPPGRGPWLH
jgi:membrane associated rhomboid family serine protease